MGVNYHAHFCFIDSVFGMKPFFTIIFFALFFSNQATSQVLINEWMASNSSVIEDPDFNESGDWIELYNSAGIPLDIGGWLLTDNLSNPDKWTIPTGTVIEAFSFVLIWADGTDTLLHSNFKLTKEAEEIGLYNPNLERIDSVFYENQKTNISMGRASDGSPQFGYFEQPSPGESNVHYAYEGITFHETQFSKSGGFYNADLEIELSTIDGDIYYTLDGSFPKPSSNLYTGPILISETTMLRARVILENHIPSKTTTHSYFINENFEERGLPIVSLSTDPGHFWDPDTGIYVQNFKPSWEYPMNIELFENDGSNRAAFNELAGTKINGLNAWAAPQKMLGVYFDNDYDENNLEYNLFFDRRRNSFDNFTLRASGSDWNSTLFRDALCQELTKHAMDLEMMAYRPSVLFVNGEYMGIHNLRSRIDEDFIEENFHYQSNEYDLIENNGEVEEGDSIAFNELFALFENDLTIESNIDLLKTKMDLDNFTDFMITEIWSSNNSWGHNIQMWKPKEEGTKWRWILQDFDRGFVGTTDVSLQDFDDFNPGAGYEWAKFPLRKLWYNEDYALKFASRFADHLYTTFHPDRVATLINEFAIPLEAEMPYHVQRWLGSTSNAYGNGMSSVDEWYSNVQELNNFAVGRNQYCFEDISDFFGLDETANLAMNVYPEESGKIEINGIKIPDSPWSGSYIKNLPFELTAIPDLAYDFTGWSVGSFETLIGLETEWKFLDNGSDQGTQWRQINFDDSSWGNGAAELGYGDGDEETVVSFGSLSEQKHVTTYFRKTFEIEDPELYTGQFVVNLLRDDGAVVYLNGQELCRSNMPNGEIASNVFALVPVAGADETITFNYSMDADVLQSGMNVLAVEIHQSSGNSSDISFDCELKALKIPEAEFFSTENTVSFNLLSDTFLVANFVPNELCSLPREITEDLNLNIDCSPYFADYNCHVHPNAKLSLDPGVEIRFKEGVSLIVNGVLELNGTESSPIVFRGIDEQKKWGAVVMKNTTGTNYLNWLEIRGATNGQHPIYENAAISGFNSDLVLDNLEIVEVDNNPILAYYSDVVLTNSTLHSQVTGDLINVKYGNGRIENCDFRGNNQIDTDAIDYDEVENGIVRNCKIYDFFGFNSDGIDLGENSSNVLIENNFIHNCTDKAVSIGQQSDITARNNILVNCNQGFALKDLSMAEIDQITFYNVGVPLACFEKNVGLGGGMAFVSNSILSNSNIVSSFIDEFSFADISNSLIDTDTLESEANHFENPHFFNPTLNNFTLKNNSPAIDLGIDDLGNSIDLGSKFNQYSAPASLLITGINYNPTGHPNAEFIEINNPGTQSINLAGYSISEAVEFVFTEGEIAPGESIFVVLETANFTEYNEQIFRWTSGRLDNRGETIRLSDPYGIVVDQVKYDNVAPWPIEADANGGSLSLISNDLDNHFAESWKIKDQEFTSIEDLSESDLSIFPNPASDRIKIKSAVSFIERFSLFNSHGLEIVALSLSEPTRELTYDLRNLAAGCYFIEMNGEVLTKKLVILP